MKNMVFEKHRELKELSQEKLASQLDICKDYVNMIENNRRIPSLRLAKRIADLFGTTVDHLFFCSYEEQNLSWTHIDIRQHGSGND